MASGTEKSEKTCILVLIAQSRLEALTPWTILVLDRVAEFTESITHLIQLIRRIFLDSI